MNNERFILEELPVIEQRADSDGNKTDYIVGYAARFGTWSSEMRHWGKPFKEKIDSRAFENVDMSKVVASINHDFKVLGRADKGTLELSVDSVGLKYSLKVPNTTAGRDALEDVRNGNLAGSSFTFTLKEDKWTFKKDQNEPDERTLVKIDKLIELGPVNMPAYPDSSVKLAKRSYDLAKEAEEKTNEESEKELFEKRMRDLQRKYNYAKLKLSYKK